MNRRQRDSYTEAFAWKLCDAYQAQVAAGEGGRFVPEMIDLL